MRDSTALHAMLECDSDFRIEADGTWCYQGSPMARHAMVRLFSTILTRDEAGEYWLKTPAEQCRITVADAPFVVINWQQRDTDLGRAICFKTNVNEWLTLGDEHPLVLRARKDTGDVVPYLTVRDGLEARLNRQVYYALMELVLAEGEVREGKRGIVSCGRFFPLES